MGYYSYSTTPILIQYHSYFNTPYSFNTINQTTDKNNLSIMNPNINNTPESVYSHPFYQTTPFGWDTIVTWENYQYLGSIFPKLEILMIYCDHLIDEISTCLVVLFVFLVKITLYSQKTHQQKMTRNILQFTRGVCIYLSKDDSKNLPSFLWSQLCVRYPLPYPVYTKNKVN